MAIMRGFVPFMLGMCLAIGFSSLSISFYEQVCSFQQPHSSQSGPIYDTLTLEGNSDATPNNEENWVYYVPPLANEDDFEPRRMVPNVSTGTPGKSRVNRPVFLADELRLKRKLLIVVSWQKNPLDTALLGVLNTTLIESAKREDTFFEKSMHFVIVNAPAGSSESDYGLIRHFAHAYSTQVVDTYEWLFLVRVSTYVTVNRLLDLVTMRLSDHAHSRVFGFWQGTPQTQEKENQQQKLASRQCSDAFGTLISSQVLRDLHAALEHQVDVADFMQSRCTDLRSELKYSSSAQFINKFDADFGALDAAVHRSKLDGTYDMHGDAQPSLESKNEEAVKVPRNPKLAALRRVLMHEHVMVVNDVASVEDYAKIHRLCVRMDLLNVENRIDELRYTLANTWHQSPYPSESADWALGVHHVPPARTRFDVLPYHYFNDTHVFFRTELSVIERLSEAERRTIRDHIEQTIALSGLALERVVNWTLVNGYRRFDPVRGVEFITDLDIYFHSPDQNQVQFVRRRIHSIRPLSKPELVPTPFASESARVTVVLFVQVPPTPSESDDRTRILFDPDIDAASFLQAINATAFSDFIKVLQDGENSYVRTAPQPQRSAINITVRNAINAIEQAATLLCGSKRGVTASCSRVVDTRVRFLFVLDAGDALSSVRRAINDVQQRVQNSGDFLALCDSSAGERNDESLPRVNVNGKSDTNRAAALSGLVKSACLSSRSIACVLSRLSRSHPWLMSDTLVLHVPDNALLSTDLLNRVRVHTMRAFQIYAPTGFQFYHPEWSRDDLFDALDMHLHPQLRELHIAAQSKPGNKKAAGGRFDQLNGPFVVQQSRGFFDTDALFDADAATRDSVTAFYLSDLQDSLESLARFSLISPDADPLPYGQADADMQPLVPFSRIGERSLFEIFAAAQQLAIIDKRKPLHIFRPVEPTLFLHYRIKPVCKHVDATSQQRCEINRANSLTVNSKLARLVTFITDRVGKGTKTAATTTSAPPPLQVFGNLP